jgi:AraC-like DNA-binding protein
MITRTYVPPPPLKDFVALFWLHEGHSSPRTLERALPSGTAELVINLRDDRLLVYDRHDPTQARAFPGALLCGPHSEYFVLDRDDQEAVLGVHFKPGGTVPFFRYPAGELHNRHVALEALWGERAGELRERLLAADTPDAKFRVLERVLLALAARPLTRHPAVAHALREFQHTQPAPTIAAVADRLGIGARRLTQLFDDEIGLSPKLYCRVRRFQDALHRIDRGRSNAWPLLALASGYFDQAHFIRDFRAFTGLSPTTYLARRGEHPNHVTLPG